MSVESDVRAYLIAQVSALTVVHLGGFPASPDDMVAIITLSGPPPALAMGPTVVMRMTALQVMVRGPVGEHNAVEALMQSIHVELQALGTVTMDSTVYDKVVALGEPAMVPVDQGERPVWSAGYEAWA